MAKAVISYNKRFSPDGCVYRQNVRITPKMYSHLANAIDAEIAMDYPRKKEYVFTSGGERNLQRLQIVNGKIAFMNLTQTRFVDLFLKQNLKDDRNTCLIVQ